MNNKTAVDIFYKMKELNKLKDISEQFKHLVEENEEINSDALLRKLRRTKDNMIKKKGQYRKEYESLSFSVPVSTLSQAPKTSQFQVFETECANLLVKPLIEDLSVKQKEKMEMEQSFEENVSGLEKSHKCIVKKLNENEKKLKYDLNHWKNKATNLRYQNLLLSRKRKRDESKVQVAKKYQKLAQNYNNIAKEKEELSKEIQELKQVNEALSVTLEKCQTDQTEKDKDEKVVDLEQEIVNLKKELKEKENENDFLLTVIDDNVEMNLFDEDSRSYSPQLRQCVMTLTSHNVATKNVAPVIQSVLKMASKTANRLPSRQTVDNIVGEKIVVGQKQIGSQLGAKKNICLYGDESRKRGKTYQTFLASDEDKHLFFLGLREMQNKASSTTLDTFKEILSDISSACEEMLESKDMSSGHSILSNICSFMSDRAKVNLSFTDLLQQYKSEVLSTITEGWEDLSDSQKVMCSKINNFFCALHLMVNMAECASPILNKFEKLNVSVGEKDIRGGGDDDDDESNIPINEALVMTLLRFCSKCFSCGGGEKSGAYSDYKAYCSQNGEKVLFVPFRGNRFNVIFLIGQVVYFHREIILTFIRDVHGARNFIQKTILCLIQKPHIIAACKVLGLISKLVTAPFWRLIEKNINILDLNTYFQTLSTFLLRKSQDAEGFVSGEDYPFEEGLIVKDKIFDELVKANEDIDKFAVQLSQMLFCGFHKLVSNALKEHLPGGLFSDPSDTLKEQSKAVIPHNKMSERVFGMLDHFIGFRPNAATIANEAFIMFSFNKTTEWLEGLSEETRNDLLKKGMKEGREMRKKFKDRCEAIEKKRKEALKEKQEALEKKAKNLFAQREKQTTEILYYGLWQTRDRMEGALSEINFETEQRKALEAQLRYRQKMLKQKFPEKNVFKFSEKGKKHSIGKLKENLLKLIEAAYSGPQEEISKGKMPLLTGKRIKHKFTEGEFYGRVISVVPGFVNFYNVVYDNDIAADGVTHCVYTYKLLEDYQKGDIEIIPESIEDQE